jgi:RHS repeat-associated protein
MVRRFVRGDGADEVLLEYASSGTVTARYVHGSDAGADDPLVWYVGSGTGTKRWLHADYHGSIIAVTNTTGGPSINKYDEYGIPATDAANNPLNTGRFQYTGQAWFNELGMYYYKARIYSPTLGRFLQVDPVGYDDQVNVYAYVGNDPVNHDDPSGREIGNLWAGWKDRKPGRPPQPRF